MVESQHTQKPAKIKIIDSLWTFCVAVAVLGPFALPLLWRNPRFQLRTKIVGSLAVLALTALLVWICGDLLKNTMDQYQQLKTLLDQH